MNIASGQFLQPAGAAATAPVLPQLESAQPTTQVTRADFVFPKSTWKMQPQVNSGGRHKSLRRPVMCFKLYQHPA
jgi:hypothetical protein